MYYKGNYVSLLNFSTNTIEYKTKDVELETVENFIEIDDSAACTKITDTNIDRIHIWSHSKQLHVNLRLRKWDEQIDSATDAMQICVESRLAVVRTEFIIV